MAKLIGTDPNQVPTNADLGSAAYADTQNMPETRLTNQPLSAKFGANGDVPTDLASTLDFMQISGSTFVQTGSDAQAFIKSNNYWNGGAHGFVNTGRGSTTIRLNQDNEGQIWFETAPSGGVATLARMIIDENGVIRKPYQPSFLAYSGGDVGFTASQNNWVAMPAYSLVQHNIGNHYNTSSDTFTCPVAGVYAFFVNVREETFYGSWGDIQIAIAINGTRQAVTRKFNGSQSEETLKLYITRNCAANDTVKVHVWVSTSDTSLAVEGSRTTWFGGHLLG